MSMTPLQSIAAVKVLDNDSIAANAVESFLRPYLSHPVVQKLRDTMMSPPPDSTAPGSSGAPSDAGGGATTEPAEPEKPEEVAEKLSEAWPAVMAFIDAQYNAGLLNATPQQYSLPEALLAHCNKVLTNGDICKFSQAVDRASAFISITNEMFDIIEKGKKLKLSDLGPGVLTHSQSTNSGLVGVADAITAAIVAAGNPIPVVAGLPTSPTLTAAIALSAMGEVAGPPSSSNFGTALGIYESATLRGLATEVESIHDSLIDNVGVATNLSIPGISDDYQQVTIRTTASSAEINALLNQLEATALADMGDVQFPAIKAQAARLAEWVGTARSAGTSAILYEVNVAAKIALNEKTSPAADILQSNTAMELAINSLSRTDARRLFAKLGATVEIDMLARYTDILDFSKITPALPASLLVATTAGSAETSTTTDKTPAHFGVLFDKIPRVVGEDKGGILLNTRARPRQIPVAAFSAMSKSQVSTLEKLSNYTGSDVAIRRALGLPETPASKMANNSGTQTAAGNVVPAVSTVADFINDGDAITESLGSNSGVIITSSGSPRSETPNSDLIQPMRNNSLRTTGAPNTTAPNTTAPNTTAPSAHSAQQVDATSIETALTPSSDQLFSPQMLTDGMSFVSIELPSVAITDGASNSRTTSNASQTESVPSTNAVASAATAAAVLSNISKAPTAQVLGQTLKQINGLSSAATISNVSNVLLNIESPSGATDLLDKQQDVIPAEIEKQFKEKVGTGSAPNSGYKLIDFFGSVCGLNNQDTLWANVIKELDAIQKNHSALFGDFSSAETTTEKAAILTSARREYGTALDKAYNTALGKFKQEWVALTTKAKVDYANLQDGDPVSAILLAKKLAQYANGLETGQAAIFQSIANASSLSGQAVVAVMTEARNAKLLQSAGLTPTSQTIAPTVSVAVTESDREKTTALTKDSNGLISTSVEAVARAREINTLPAPQQQVK